jgi:hypothetical protein
MKLGRGIYAILESKSIYFSDTSPEMEALQVKIQGELPSWRKLEMMAQLNAAAQMLALSGLRQRYPGAGEKELQRRLADLLLGEELARKVYGDLVDAA